MNPEDEALRFAEMNLRPRQPITPYMRIRAELIAGRHDADYVIDLYLRGTLTVEQYEALMTEVLRIRPAVLGETP